MEKLVKKVVEEARNGWSSLPQVTKSKLLQNYKGQLLAFQSYNPSIDLSQDLVESHTTTTTMMMMAREQPSLQDQVCLVPYRDHKYLTFKDKYYLLFQNNNAMNTFLESMPMENGSIVTNHSNIRLKLTPVNKQSSFIKYYTQLYNTLQNYNSSSETDPLKAKDITDPSKLISLHNNSLQPIMDKSLLLWNYQVSSNVNLESLFWYYDITNCINLFNDPNGPTTLHYLSFNSIQERNKFNSNIHGSFLNKNKLLIEPL